ncbi:hypothetical protein V6N13_033468 [Hibiscus sabdariffa]|uniref:Bulb-type lectin domain-containing protein n=1 Tax=Hibiscus sabdariffa TaxID=183260 RepID=A0ABR2FAD4_9ROSI
MESPTDDLTCSIMTEKLGGEGLLRKLSNGYEASSSFPLKPKFGFPHNLGLLVETGKQMRDYAMKIHSKNPVFVSLVPFIFLLYSFAQFCYAATDTLRQGKTLRNGDTLISENNVFELGFFSLESSSFTYLGIWYTFDPKAVVWVANRDTPISHKNGVLRIEVDGKLVLLDGNNSLVWSSSVTGSSNNTAAKLLDTGNFVLPRDDRIGDLNMALWQSFNQPTDTFLPGMRVPVCSKRGMYRAFRSWKSPNDPSPGNYSVGVDPNGGPQIVIWDNDERR